MADLEFETDDGSYGHAYRVMPGHPRPLFDVDLRDTTSTGRAPLERRASLTPPGRTVAVLLPCRDEEDTIGKVVRDFRSAIPDATIYVYDNASTDATPEAARSAGAVVRYCPIPGKGNVLRQMFAEIDATEYVLVDGDDTYDASAAPAMLAKLRERRVDMVIGTRDTSGQTRQPSRLGHRQGNWILSRSVRWLFGDGSLDMLSGYRVLSRQYVKSFPAFSTGFETETEMTVHALDLCLPFEEMPTVYRPRPQGSASKLRTARDGARILKLILLLCKDYRPLRFFGFAASSAALLAVALGLLAHGHLHAWTPATFLVAALSAIALISILAGVILDSLGRNNREIKRMLYLAVRPNAPGQDRREWAASVLSAIPVIAADRSTHERRA